MTGSSASGGGGKQHDRNRQQEEFPTIREQDLAIIVADWLRLKAKQPLPQSPGDVDPIDLTVIVAELSRGLHLSSLRVIHNAVPQEERWVHLRNRLEQLIIEKDDDDQEYGHRVLPVH